MREMAKSPSDFIYRSRGTSFALPAQDNLTMEHAKPTAATSRQHHAPLLAGNFWEMVSDGLPSCVKVGRRATFPNAKHHGGTEGGLQRELLPQDTCASLRCICPICQHQGETPNTHLVGGVPPITTCQYHPEPTDPAMLFPPHRAPSYAPGITSDSSSQLPFPIPHIDTPSFSCHFPSPVTQKASSRTSTSYSSNSGQSNRICAIVHAVHDICLQSTKTWLDTHLVNRRARASNSSLLSDEHLDFADGVSSPIHPKTERESKNCFTNSLESRTDIDFRTSRGNISYPFPRPTNSLLKNVSSICNMLWAGSQRDRLDVLNVERTTVGIMNHLLCWSETVALGDYDEWQMADEEALLRVLQAGKNLCNWLDVPDGIQAIGDLDNNIAEFGYGIH
ncbi:hypothetical protein F5B19DRAFT_414801 [Rostrohypoxylon terebratum]|nr:hypothetical protein F5B19DRAFT_414801 [Rostrohypoxylon terebratum]